MLGLDMSNASQKDSPATRLDEDDSIEHEQQVVLCDNFVIKIHPPIKPRIKIPKTMMLTKALWLC
jgi:hypothetical protein